MITDTTVCIHRETYEILTAAAMAAGVSRHQFISSLMKHSSKKMRKLHEDWTRARYQARRTGEKWSRMHVRVRKDEYDFFFDLRKVTSFSLSHLIAYATEHYIDELLALMKKNTDNYRYRNYAINQLFIDDVECWIVYWGIPSKFITFPPPS
jgi:hypothetical protein